MSSFESEIKRLLPKGFEIAPCADGSFYIQFIGKSLPASLISINWLKQHRLFPQKTFQEKLQALIALKCNAMRRVK